MTSVRQRSQKLSVYTRQKIAIALMVIASMVIFLGVVNVLFNKPTTATTPALSTILGTSSK